MPSHPLPQVVACGAYERDNIGDLLFLVVSAHFAKGVVETEFTAPIAADMTALLGREITSTGAQLSSREIQGIWTVGGEVGSTLREYVYRTAVDAEEWERFSELDATTQDTMLDEVMEARLESPYVPRPSSFPLNHSARLVLNSIGISGISGLPAWRAAVATSALREARYISVRDQKSADLLDQLDIPHRLAPDLVHTIAEVMPIDDRRGDTVLLQLSESHIRASGLPAWIDAVAGCAELGSRPVRLFVAGFAPAHDSVDLYRELIAGVRALRPDWDIALSDSTTIEDRVREIATASLWIGSSLHGRIIACAYGTRRISIEKPKVDVYARTWDPEFPLAIGPETLASAVTQALTQAHDPALSTALADQARQSVTDALSVLSAPESSPDDATLLQLRVRESAELQVAAAELQVEAKTLERAHADTVQASRAQAAEIARLARDRQEQRDAKRRTDAELRAVRTRLAEIEGSTSWRLGSRLVSAARSVRIPRGLRRLFRKRR